MRRGSEAMGVVLSAERAGEPAEGLEQASRLGFPEENASGMRGRAVAVFSSEGAFQSRGAFTPPRRVRGISRGGSPSRLETVSIPGRLLSCPTEAHDRN